MGPPKPPMPHVAPVYRLTATALGAGMWFWVRRHGLLLFAKSATADRYAATADVPSKERWYATPPLVSHIRI